MAKDVRFQLIALTGDKMMTLGIKFYRSLWGNEIIRKKQTVIASNRNNNKWNRFIPKNMANKKKTENRKKSEAAIE